MNLLTSLLFAPLIWGLWEILLNVRYDVCIYRQNKTTTTINPTSVILTLATYGLLLLVGAIR